MLVQVSRQPFDTKKLPEKGAHTCFKTENALLRKNSLLKHKYPFKNLRKENLKELFLLKENEIL